MLTAGKNGRGDGEQKDVSINWVRYPPFCLIAKVKIVNASKVCYLMGYWDSVHEHGNCKSNSTKVNLNISWLIQITDQDPMKPVEKF